MSYWSEALRNKDTVKNVSKDAPHSRACGVVPHAHGPNCHSNCPSCGGFPVNEFDPNQIDEPLTRQGDEFFHSAMPAPEFDPDSTPIQKAIRLVYSYIKPRLEKTDRHYTFSEDEVYSVWFNYTLGNWKALLSTTLPDGMYYEVTANSVSGEFYLDAYKKFDNITYKA